MDQPLKMSGGSIEPMPQPPVHQKYREQNLYDPAGRGDSAPNGEAQRRHTKSGFQRRQGDASLIASIEGVLPDSAASFQSPGLGDRHGKDTVNVPIGQSPQGTLKYGHDMQTATSSNASHAQHQVGGTSKFPPSDPKHRQNQNVNHPINKAGVPQRPDAFLGNQLPMSEAQYWENLVVNFDKENGLDGPNGYTAGSTIGVPNAGFGASMGGDITGYVRRDAEEVGKNSQFQTNGRRPVETTAPSTSSKRHTSSSHAASEMEPSQNHTNEGSAQREEPTAGDHQPDDPNFMYGLAFKNSEDMTIARKQTAFHCLQPDPSIPNTDLAKRKVVRQVMDAILAPPAPAPNTANRRNAYGGRFAPGKAYYTALDIEEVAWILVEAAADVHKNGFTARQADRQVLADMAKTKDWSFAERMNLICDILRARIARPFLLVTSTNRTTEIESHLRSPSEK